MAQHRAGGLPFEGIGVGPGFAVMLDPAQGQMPGSRSEYSWTGSASTAFWIDPTEGMAVVLLTQLTPSTTYPIQREPRVLTYQAIVDQLFVGI
jgi:CubicO group peptidase (beta-lactamase class C family)